MSLQVYLPLNGDTKNYGLNTTIVTANNNLTFNPNGLNGLQCLEATAPVPLNIPQSLYDVHSVANTEISYSLWIKIDRTFLNQWISTADFSSKTQIYNKVLGFNVGTTSNGLGIHIRTNENLTNSTVLNQVYVYGWLRTGGSSNGSTATLINLDEWYHLALTYSATNEFCFYINGTLIEKKTIARNNINTTISAQDIYLNTPRCELSNSTANTKHQLSLKEYINHVKIYNHTLSAAEVAFLAKSYHKALELWMPLNNQLTSFGTKKITATATAVTYVQGKTGLNATFNGSTSVINTDYVWAPTTGWTIAGWVKHTSATPHGTLVRASTNHSPAIDFDGTNGALRYFYWKTSSTYNIVGTSYIPEQNSWHHYVVTWDGTKMSCYIDGSLLSSLNCTDTPYIDGGTIQIGNNSVSGALTGSIADVRLYNYGLTESEVYELSLGKVGHVMCNCKQLSTAGKDDYNGFGMYRSRCACSAVATTRKQADSPRYQGSFLTNGAYLNLGSSFRYTVDACTFSIWAYAASWGTAAWGTATYASFLSSIEGGGRGMQYLKASGNLTFGDATIGYATTVSADLAAGWHLFTWVIDGWQTKLYIDGELISSSTAKDNKTALHNKANYLFIGYECAGTKTYSNGQFKGKVSNLEIFTKALTANDISKIYAKAHIPPAPST